MKTIVTGLATAAVLAGTAGGGLIHAKRLPPRKLPQPSKVDLVTCAPRIDGVDGYFCAETPNTPRAGYAKATILFVKQGDNLFGVRQPLR
jgi:hypothetical protein